MHRTRRANTLQWTRFDPTLRNTIADYHTRYRVRAWHATRPATLGNDFQLSFASSVRRVAFLDRNLGNVLLRIVIVGPMQYTRRIEYISCRRRDVDAGACIFRSIDALVRPDAFPGVTDWNSVSRCENFLATTRDTEPSSLFFFFVGWCTFEPMRTRDKEAYQIAGRPVSASLAGFFVAENLVKFVGLTWSDFSSKRYP